jgi:hypothetical protein
MKGIIKMIKESHERGIRCIEITQDAVTEYNVWIQKGIRKMVWTEGRTAWHNNAEGFNFALWPYSGTYMSWVYSARPDWSKFVTNEMIERSDIKLKTNPLTK